MASHYALWLLALAMLGTGMVTARADEIPMEDTDAYRTAFEANPCCTACAVVPSAAIKATHSCDPVNAAECICRNITLSVELRSSIWQYCLDHCGPASAPYATSILADYCRRNLGTVPVTNPGTGPTSSLGTAVPLPSISSPTQTAATGTTNTAVSTPGSGDGGGKGLSAGELAGIIISVIGTIAGVVAAWVAVTARRARKIENQENGAASEVELREIQSTQAPA